jgi:hypothetical protein
MTGDRAKRRRRTGNGLRLAVVAIASAAALAGCGGGVDSGGLTAGDRSAAQAAMDALQTSNIPAQLVDLTATAGLAPAACQVHLESKDPSTFKVYVFWIPYIGPQSYSWLDMTITKDASLDKFHLGTAASVLPGGDQLPGGAAVAPAMPDYDTPLSQYGPQQAKVNERVLMAHAGNVFTKPEAKCQVLMNGYLRLMPNP